MHSEHIKAIVAKTNVIVQTGDTNIESNEVRNLMSSLLLTLCSQSTKNHYFAIAIFQYLVDHGFMMSNIRGEAMTAFTTKFGKAINHLSDDQKVAIKQVSDRLFSPTRI